jgi:prepilin-type N-terminal cleavage/methylation domain-containing protein
MNCFNALNIKRRFLDIKVNLRLHKLGLSLTGFTPLEIKQQGGSNLRKCQRHFLSLTGFTLIEVLAASVIITLISVGMISAFESGTYLLMEARQKMESALVAQSKFEELINSAKTVSGYNNITGDNIDIPSYYKLNKWIKSAKYSVIYVEPINNAYKEIKITISYNFRNKDYSEEFVTLVYNPTNITE